MYHGDPSRGGGSPQGNTQINAANCLGAEEMAENSQGTNYPGSRGINMSEIPVKYNSSHPVIHDFLQPNTAHVPPPFWRPTAVDFEENMQFSSPSILQQTSENDVNLLMQEDGGLSADILHTHSSLSSQSSGFHPCAVPVLSVKDSGVGQSRSEGNTDYVVNSGLDEQDDVSSGPSGSVSSGSLPYTSLCLVGTPSSTVAEFQPESAPSQSEGTYTLLESQKGKEVDTEKEAEMYNQIKTVLCDLCGKRFESDGALNKHRRHHDGLHPHVCHVCGKGFPWKAKLDNHMVTHTDSNNKPFMCEVCGKHFRNHGYLLMHTKMHKVGRMYRCSLCGRELLRLNHLKKHLELKHTKEGIFEGDSSKLYTSNEFLNRTMRISKDNRYETRTCEYCEIELPDEAAYIIHKKIHLSKGEVKCRYCAKVVYNYAYLKMHEKSHTVVKSHKCDLCGKMFHRYSQLRNHMHTHAWIRKSKCKTVVKLDIHGALKATENNTCLICEKGFSSIQELQAHNQDHTVDDRTYRCILCGQSFDGLDSLSSLKHHMMKCHKVDKPYQCTQCEKSFFKGHQLKCHMRVHSKDRPYRCDQCQQSFLRENQLKIHYASHTGEKPFPCDKCEKGFSSPAGLRLHKVIHDENAFFCKLCYKPMSTKSNMESHMVKVHSGDSLVYCDVCNVPFSRMSYVTAHMQESHKGYVLKGTTKCPKCPRRFVRKSSLKVHMRAHASEMPFKCDICGKGFALENNMIVHKKSHFNAAGELNANPLQCDICRKMFKRPIDCRKHQVAHSKIQRYKCDLCGKGFAYPHSLKRHKETHFQSKMSKKPGPKGPKKLEIQEYKCDLCKAKFPIEELLDEHKNTHFDDSGSFECPVCGEGFRRKGEMKKHHKTHEEDSKNDTVYEERRCRNACLYECDVCEEKFRSLVELQIHDEIHCISPKRLESLSQNSDSSDSDLGDKGGVNVIRGRRSLQNSRQYKAVKSLQGKFSRRRKCDSKSIWKPGAPKNRTANLKKLSYKKPKRKQPKYCVKQNGSDQVRFECNQCSYHFASISELKNHTKTHKDLKPLICTICGDSFSMMDTLEMHLEGHTGSVFSCDVCGADFNHYIDLNNHMTAYHPSLMKRRGRPKKRPFSCSICRMCFGVMEHLDAHKMMHTASVRLKREIYDFDTVKLSEVNHLLCNVKCEVEDNMDVFGSTSSEVEHKMKVNPNEMTNIPDLPSPDFDPPEIADVPSPESPEHRPPSEITPSPESHQHFDQPEIGDAPMSKTEGQTDLTAMIDAQSLSVTVFPEPSDDFGSSLSDRNCLEPGAVPIQQASGINLSDQFEDCIPDSDKCFKCSVCDEYFVKSSSLECHLTVHTDTQQPWRFHLVSGTASTYACVHINSVTKSCTKSFEDM